MTSIIEVAEASYHKPVILHCVIMTRFQLFFFANCITITIIVITLITRITIINIIIIITIITLITIITPITII